MKSLAQSLCLLSLPLLYSSISTAQSSLMTVRIEEHHDVSPTLRDLIAAAQPQSLALREAEPVGRIPLPPGLVPLPEDPVRQRTVSTGTFAPTAGLSFEGLGAGQYGFAVTGAPPDTEGTVGATQYVQWVNTSFAVFNKSTGALIVGPTAGNTLWSGFGGGCQNNNDGDPIVLYDKAAQRWIFSQFSVSTTPPLQFVAVSTTSDATGTYNRYSFQYNDFDDYPKMSVWADAYYETFNMFDTNNNFVGSDACAYDRNAMLAGTSATQVCFQQNSSIGGLLPSDIDGSTPPPAGSPNYMVNFGNNSLNLFQFHVDFTTPNNSTFTGPTVIPVAAFSPLCGGGTCIPQPGTTNQLDSLADRLMYRLAYRNFGAHESLVVNHSVVAGSSGGVRWYEIQNPSGTPVVAQQSTFAPDSSYRWMGSIAMDKAGDMALGYSVSDGSSVHPSIALTGRLATDPASNMQAETTIIGGTGSQTVGSKPLTRWGDYSAMQVDPTDDCTLWYTNEYIKVDGTFNWNTRIATFSFPGCTGTTTFPLTVNVAGTGSGTVTSTPAGISCPGTCSATFAGGTSVTLTASAAAGSTFAGWSGACTGTGSCTVKMNAAQSVTATFNPVANFALSVTMAGTGSGTVTSAPAGISCPGTCSASFAGGTSVTLTASAAAGSTFTGWTGACTGSGSCTVTISAAQSVTATFRVATTAALTVSSSQPDVGTNVTFTVKILPASGSATPTGTVTFSNGSTALGTAQLSSGTASLTTNSLVAGNYSITAAYSGDTSFGGSSSAPLALMVVDLSMTAAQTSLTVTRGQSTSTTLTVTPTPLANFNPTVTFACSGLPAESSCLFKPSTVTLNGASSATTLTVQTTAPSARSQLGFGGTSLFYAAFLPGLLSILIGNKKYKKRLPGSTRILVLACLMFSTVWWSACGNSDTSSSRSGNSNPGTPVGSSNITVTATSSGTNPITKQVAIALTVQ